MATAKRKSKTYTISLPPEMAERAEAIAKEESRTMSELFREALRVYQAERALKVFREAAEYGVTLNPNGYSEEDIPALVKEIRAEMWAERQRKSRIAG
jgi:CopG family transcriptional regulator/antitoxin EndoAI